MESVKQIYRLLLCQGFYLGSVCQQWMFSLEMTALIGSCVEIPCTYTPDGTTAISGTVWYLYNSTTDLEILNTKDSSSVIEEYKDRTSLVPGEKSCTLRIDPVRREDGGNYYPGIAEDKEINAYENQAYLYITDQFKIELKMSKIMTEGEAATIRCSVEHTCRSRPPSIQWNKPGQVKKQSVDMYGGFWREESELTYIPTYVDDGSPVQCTVVHPNGQRSERSERLNINYAPKNVTVTAIKMGGSATNILCNIRSKPDAHEYEWYKGENKSRLPDRGREITVYNVTRDMEPYSCTAINTVGRGESALTEIPVLYGGSDISIIILPAVVGTICLLLLVSLGYVCWRKRSQKLTSNETETPPDATYTDLVKRDIENGYGNLEIKTSPDATYTDPVERDTENYYEQIKTSPEATYTELMKKDTENDYEQLKVSEITTHYGCGMNDDEF